MLDVLSEVRNLLDSGFFEIREEKGELKLKLHRYYSGKVYLTSSDITELNAVARKHGVEILLKANKSTISIAVGRRTATLFDFATDEFRVDEEEMKKLEFEILSRCLPFHVAESLRKAFEYARDLDELSKRLEFDELIRRGINHDPPEVVAESELKFRIERMIEQAKQLGIILQKLKYLGIPYELKIYPLVEMLRVPTYDILIKQRILKVSDVAFLIDDEALKLARVHLEPSNRMWLWTFF